MSYNGSGVYTLPGAALVNGEIVSATENNQFRNDVAAALNLAWTRDGQAPATANIPMGNHKLTGLSAGTGNGDSVRFEQLPSATNKLDLTTSVTSTLPVANGGSGAATLTGILKGNGTSAFSAAAAGTDYLAPAAIGTTVQGYAAELQGATQGGINGMKNRIINGAMMIDQRNAGASVSATGYIVDRFYGAWGSLTWTAQQNAGSVTPSAGFVNYLGITSGAANSVTSGTSAWIGQKVEGLNIADLGWGAVGAASITLSFWVRSSLTGTFGGSIGNSGLTRCYPFTYTISSANTWEQKSITIPGDTTGTWLTTNGTGIQLMFQLGVGSTYQGTAGSWSGSTYTGATGATNPLATNGATFYITGVQLEKGSVATSFDYRPYGTELALCQRYYYCHASGATQSIGMGCNNGTAELDTIIQFPVTMRTAPSLVATSGTNYYRFIRNGANDDFNSFTLYAASTTCSDMFNTSEISGTSGWAGYIVTLSSSAYIGFSSEL